MYPRSFAQTEAVDFLWDVLQANGLRTCVGIDSRHGRRGMGHALGACRGHRGGRPILCRDGARGAWAELGPDGHPGPA